MNYTEALEIFNLNSLSDITEEDFKILYRKFARSRHPDTNNGSSKDFVELKKGNALQLPIADESIDIAAQNCLFNIFKAQDLKKALQEMYRVLKPHGRLVMSDPTCEQVMNEALLNDDHLRALCLSGSIPIAEYIKALTDVGFGTIEIGRAHV